MLIIQKRLARNIFQCPSDVINIKFFSSTVGQGTIAQQGIYYNGYLGVSGYYKYCSEWLMVQHYDYDFIAHLPGNASIDMHFNSFLHNWPECVWYQYTSTTGIVPSPIYSGLVSINIL